MPRLIGAHFNASAFVLGERATFVENSGSKRNAGLATTRTLAAENELPRHLASKSAKKLITQIDFDPKAIDLILYSSSFADTVNIGFGPYVQKEIGATGSSVLQVDTACASFLSQIELADALIKSGRNKNILAISLSHMISRMPKAQAQGPGLVIGEGASAVLLTRGAPSFDIDNAKIPITKPPIQAYPTRSEEHDWQANGSPFKFSESIGQESRLSDESIQVIARSFECILSRNMMSNDKLDYLVTNFPNENQIKIILDNLEIPPSKLISTFSESGDLAQASIPTQLTILRAKHPNRDFRAALLNFSLDGQHIASGLFES